MKLVKFKNLLEEDKCDIQFGLLGDDSFVYCLCGCEGCFEEGDYEIVERYGNFNMSKLLFEYFQGFRFEILEGCKAECQDCGEIWMDSDCCPKCGSINAIDVALCVSCCEYVPFDALDENSECKDCSGHHE